MHEFHIGPLPASAQCRIDLPHFVEEVGEAVWKGGHGLGVREYTLKKTHTQKEGVLLHTSRCITDGIILHSSSFYEGLQCLECYNYYDTTPPVDIKNPHEDEKVRPVKDDCVLPCLCNLPL